ncbi:MAG TPA: hypothetical protein VHE35_10765, partial [Kofleriaceae bacterium]|nr:hypothetical protein [Kofleriaceae bacterium]
KFLESAPQGWAQAVLRIGEDEDDGETIDVDEEPLALDALTNATVLRDAFTRYLAGAAQADALEAAWTRLRNAGAAPLGVFGEVVRDACAQRIAGWAHELEHRGGRTQGFRVTGFGRATAAGAAVYPPLALEVELGGRPRTVQLLGQTELYGVTCGALVLANGEPKPRHRLRPAFDHLVMAAAGLADTGFKHLILSRTKTEAMTHDRWPAADARRHLALLLRDLFAEGHGYLLSLEMAIDAMNDEPVEVEAPSDRGPGSIGYGPLGPRGDLDPPPDPRALAVRRLEPMWRRMKLS